MLFSLEALQAKHGDCLILYYGKKTDPKVIVIDGGPAGIYKGFLKPRLEKIKQKISPQDPLPLSMLMVSHLDDDHVNGVLGLVGEVADKNEANEAPLVEISNLWVNSFDDIIGNLEIPSVAGAVASVAPASIASFPGYENAPHEIAAVIVSTGQGRKLRDLSTTLNLQTNNPFKAIKKGKARLVRGDGKGSKISWESGLKITVVHPNEQRLKELQTQWDKDLKKAKAKGDPSISIASIIDPDTSPFNLSSIVCLMRAGKKTMLLTGDARADDILDGLQQNKLLKNGKLHVDLLKIPHHGSSRNADVEFFKAVTADHYIISADGAHHNPDKATLDMLLEAGITGTLYFTNHSGKLGVKKVIDGFVKKLKQKKQKLKVVFRKDDAASVLVNLEEKISF